MAGRKPGTGTPAVYQAAACRAALARHPSGRQVEQQYVGDRVVRDALHEQFARLVHVTARIARRQRATVHFGGASSAAPTSDLQSLLLISYAVFCLKQKPNPPT